MPNNAVIIDAGESQGFQNNAISLSATIIYNFINLETIPQGKIVKPKKLIGNKRFLILPQNLPSDFVYWNFPYYITE